MFKFSKNPEGFTLVELMVVVAIIGILSAIAVPNFKKYQAKSKQSEAKIQLAAVYNAEVGASADWDTYATCLGDLGYEKSPKGYYVVGFQSHDSTTTAPIITSRGGTCGTGSNYYFAGSGTGQGVAGDLQKATGVAVATTDLPTSISQNSFTAGAAGNIGTGNAGKDIWVIDNTKKITNTGVGY